MPTIAFEGRHCSGQRDPGRLVAKELGFDFVDRIMLAEIAKKVGSTVEAVSMRKLKKPSIIDMLAKGINQILNSSPTVGVGGDPYFGPGIENAMSKEFYELDETIIKNPEDVDRRFIITFYLNDDTVMVYEPQQRNSGIVSGKFLEKCKYKNTKRNMQFFEPADFIIGNEHYFFK